MNIYNKIRRNIAKKVVNRKTTLNLSEAIISFTFDDVPNSAFTEGAAILRKFGYNGTYYVALSLFEEGRPCSSNFNSQHLNEVIKEGSELACHTYGHLNYYHSNDNQIIADLEKNQDKIAELIPNYKFTNFSYPYGAQTISARRIVKDKFISARGVQSGINHNNIDLIDLKAHQLGSHMKLDDFKGIIDQAIKLKGWLIFFTHEIKETPKEFDCTPALLQGVADYCSKKCISVLTIEKAMKLIAPTLVGRVIIYVIEEISSFYLEFVSYSAFGI